MYTLIKRAQYRVLVPAGIAFTRLFFNERNANKKSHLNPPPFFIIGSGRNGSTLLSAMLNKNPQLFLPPEQFVLPYAMMQWQLYRHHSATVLFNRFLDLFSKSHKTSNWDVNFAALKESVNAARPEGWAFNTFTDYVFRYYGNQTKQNFIWGDQSPMMTHFVPFIHKLFPAAKFIFLVRDPRDVILSCSKMKHSPVRNIKTAAWKWNDSVKMYEWLQKHHAKNLMLLRYEDLVTAPETELKRVTDFLQVDFNKEMLDHRDQVSKLGVSDVDFHQNLKNPLSTGSIGKWKEEFTPEKAREVTTLVEKNMSRFGYV